MAQQSLSAADEKCKTRKFAWNTLVGKNSGLGVYGRKNLFIVV